MSGKLELRGLIARKGLNEGELAKIIGISPATMSQILNEKVDPKISVVEKICYVLEIDNPSEYFFSHEFRLSKQKIS